MSSGPISCKTCCFCYAAISSHFFSALCMKELFEQGGTKEQVEDALRIMPFVRSLQLRCDFARR